MIYKPKDVQITMKRHRNMRKLGNRTPPTNHNSLNTTLKNTEIELGMVVYILNFSTEDAEDL